jgi:mannosyltransferase
MPRVSGALALVCVAGAVLRFATLDLQSLWFDEAVTAQLLRMDFGGLLEAIPDSESTPPLYYVLGWLWAQVFGTGEAGLRSLPALCGTATIGVVWALGRRLGGERAGLAAAALVAVNPMLVWFSQEARAYALLVLLAAIAALLWLRALERPRPGRAAAWSIVAALALATHYYAVFVVAPMALWLVVRAPGIRVRAAALAPVAAGLAALAPLLLHQRSNAGAAFIGDSALLSRIAQVPKQLVVGYDAPGETLLAVASLALLAVAGWGVWRIVARGEAGRDETGAALVLPMLAAVAGEDHVIARNLLAAAPLGAALAGAGLVAAGAALPRLGVAAVAAACAIGLVTIAGVAADAGSQRDDWRGAVRALGHADGERIVVATPGAGLTALRYYLPGARRLDAPGAITAEIDYLALSERRPGQRAAPPRPPTPPAPAPGFAPAGGREGETFTVVRLRAPAPLPVGLGAIALGLDGTHAAVLVARR